MGLVYATYDWRGLCCRYVQGTTAQGITTPSCFSRQLSAAGYARHSLTKMTISLAVYLSYLDKTVPQASMARILLAERAALLSLNYH